MNRSQRRAAKAKTGWVPLRRVVLKPHTPEQIEAAILSAKRIAPELPDETVRDIVTGAGEEIHSSWANDKYMVHVIPWPAQHINGHNRGLVQLSIRRQDRLPARDWRDLQRIKTQLLGPEVEAVELYPAESRLVDTANQFHLWAVADPLFRFPFGWNWRRATSSETEGTDAQQRPLEVADGPRFVAKLGWRSDQGSQAHSLPAAHRLPLAPISVRGIAPAPPFDPVEFARLVKLLGLAFHPDTAGHEYMNGEGNQLWPAAEAEHYDEVMAAARIAAEAGTVPDPYEMGMEIWRQEGLIEGERWGR